MARRHVLITGTGRSGTTFLVMLLTYLGLDTGFTAQQIEERNLEAARGGLENDMLCRGRAFYDQERVPRIVKSPCFCDCAEEVVERDDITIEHVFIPVRELHAAAESRRYVQERTFSGRSAYRRLKDRIYPENVVGGLWHTKRKAKQEQVLLRQIYRLVLALSGTTIPMTLMRYPRIVKDASYLFGKLRPILDGISFRDFNSTFERIARADYVHSFNEKDR